MGAEITFTRSGGRGVPPERESITIHADGSFDARRAVNVPAAGRFAGTLDGALSRRVADAASAAAGAAPPSAKQMPGAARETIRLGGAAAVDVSRDVPEPWRELRAAVIDALDAAVASPVAAVRLVVEEASARLEPVGDVEIEFDGARLTAVLWTASYEEKARAEVAVDGTSVSLDGSLRPTTGERLQVTVAAALRERAGASTPVQLVAERVG